MKDLQSIILLLMKDYTRTEMALGLLLFIVITILKEKVISLFSRALGCVRANYLRTKIKITTGVAKSQLDSKLSMWASLGVFASHIQDDAICLLYKDVMTIEIKDLKSKIETLETTKIDKNEPLELLELVSKTMLDSSSFETMCESKGIPRSVVLGYIKEHRTVKKYIINTASVICRTSLYNSNRSRLDAIYIITGAILEVSISESEALISKLANRLDGIYYGGYKF